MILILPLWICQLICQLYQEQIGNYSQSMSSFTTCVKKSSNSQKYLPLISRLGSWALFIKSQIISWKEPQRRRQRRLKGGQITVNTSHPKHVIAESTVPLEPAFRRLHLCASLDKVWFSKSYNSQLQSRFLTFMPHTTFNNDITVSLVSSFWFREPLSHGLVSYHFAEITYN